METAGILMVLGALVKHIAPSKKINRFIPLINFGIATGVGIAQGRDPLSAVINGAQESLMATGGHQAVKNYVLPSSRVQIRGQSI